MAEDGKLSIRGAPVPWRRHQCLLAQSSLPLKLSFTTPRVEYAVVIYMLHSFSEIGHFSQALPYVREWTVHQSWIMKGAPCVCGSIIRSRTWHEVGARTMESGISYRCRTTGRIPTSSEQSSQDAEIPTNWRWPQRDDKARSPRIGRGGQYLRSFGEKSCSKQSRYHCTR